MGILGLEERWLPSILFGLMAAAGVATAYFTILSPILFKRQSAIERLLEMGEYDPDEDIPYSNAYVRRIARMMRKRTDKDYDKRLERMIRILGKEREYPDVDALYYKAVIAGLAYALFGAVAAFIMVVFLGLPSLLFLAVPLISYFGYRYQFSTIESEMKKRNDLLLIEFPRTIAMLLTYYNTLNSLAGAILRYVSRPSRTAGYMFAELKRIADSYNSGKSLPDAILEAEERVSDVPLIQRAFYRLRQAELSGTDIINVLRITTGNAYAAVRDTMLVRSKRSQSLALVPIVISVGGVLFIVLLQFIDALSAF